MIKNNHKERNSHHSYKSIVVSIKKKNDIITYIIIC